MSNGNLVERIQSLKKERNAVLLVHNYQRGEVQDVGDFVGDSLGLSQEAARTDAGVIVFCGVHFMAETAKLLNPDKTVLVPDPNAGCPMANMLTVRELIEKKKEHPGAAVICYVNSTAAVKAESDICCTSANAPTIMASIPEDREIIFVPDKHLGRWAAEQLGRKNVILWDGFCPTHQRILPEEIDIRKEQHPGAPVVVHPECTEETLAAADHVGSTSGILKFCRQSDAKEFIIGTEIGILHRLRKENPGKTFYPVTEIANCPNMKLNTLQKLVWCLEDMAFAIDVPEDIADKARQTIEKMLERS
ncbi:MAG: quinolinate synthase NadA [Planctomycetes bacterium]|nr:quinolinate synthase NadA [Planctomycetota bacterium]